MNNKDILLKFISNQGYKRNSPDVNNPINVIPSPNISMKNVDFPVQGTDNYGNTMVMQPGGEYTFPGDYVVEQPLTRFDKGGPSKVSNTSQLNPIVQYYAEEMYKRFGKVIITDKATNTTYYGTKRPDGTWDLAQFEVLTGKHHNISDQKNDLTPRTVDDTGAGKGGARKITSLGTFTMTPYDHRDGYNMVDGTGYKLDETFNGKSYNAYHQTYVGPDDKSRTALYNNNNSEDNYRSFGCVNCEKPSMEALEKFIGKGKGHTTIIDTRLSLKENDQWIRKNTPQNSWMPPKTDIPGSYTRNTAGAANAGSANTTVERGDPKVRELQKQLNQQLGANLVVDGIRGPKTKAAEEKYNNMVRREELFAKMDSLAPEDEIPVIPMEDSVASVPQKDITVPTPTAGAKVPVAEPAQPVVEQRAEVAPPVYSEAMGEGMAPYRKPVEGAPYSAEYMAGMPSAPQVTPEEAVAAQNPKNSKDSFYLPEGKMGGMPCLECGGQMKQGGEMIKRADGSYSQRGFWDNIRDNKGSGKKPTKKMLEMERKLNKKAEGGEADPDGGMALGQIDAMMDRLTKLRQFIKPESDLEPWISDKLSVMNHSATAMSDYYGFNPEAGEQEMESDQSPLPGMKNGGGIPARYKNMGFTKVGQKKDSTSAGKKWMVLAKKGDQYKVVHGGYDGMKDYTQHGSEERRDRFWDRMGGKDSAKANDPFSPLYWHKRFGTWAEGGELPEMQNAGKVKERTFLGTASQFLPGYEGYLDYRDVVEGAATGNKEQLNTGVIGLSSPVSGKALSGSLDYLTEIFLGKETADKNESKRSGIINLSTADLQKLYAKYGPGGYDKWVSDGMPKLARGGDAYKGPYNDMYQEGDFQADTTTKRQVSNLKYSNWNKGLAAANLLTDPRNGALQYLPDEGFGSGLKGILGAASGLAGATLGYEKMFAKPTTDSKLMNNTTGEYGNTQDVLKARYDKANPAAPAPAPTPEASTEVSRRPMTKTGGSGMGAVFNDGMMGYNDEYTGDYTNYEGAPSPTPAPMNEPAPKGNMKSEFYEPEFAMGGLAKYQDAGTVSFNEWFVKNATRQDVMSNSANRALLEQMWRAETGQAATEQTNEQKIGTPNAPFGNTTAGQTVTLNQNSNTPGMRRGPGSGMYGMDQGMYEFDGYNYDGTDVQQPGPALPPPPKPTMQQTYKVSEYGDNAGFVGATNALNGLGIANNVLGARQNKDAYKQRVRDTGNTDDMYNAYNPKNAYGKYTTNVGLGSNYALVLNTPTQDFSDVGAQYGGMKNYREGGSYNVSREEILRILAAGGEIEFL